MFPCSLKPQGGPYDCQSLVGILFLSRRRKREDPGNEVERSVSLNMAFRFKKKTFVAAVSVFLTVLFLQYMNIKIGSTPVERCWLSEPSKNSSKSPLSNPLQDLEVYVRYTTADAEFPKQAEAWLFRSISLFWPKNATVIVVLDKENAGDRVYGSKIKKSTWSKKISFKVCYMEPYPPEMIHRWSKMRMYMDMMHADLCTNATYVGLVDVDTLFTTAVTPSLVLEAGKPVVTGRIGEPRIPCWIKSSEYVLGIKQVIQCMHYFPVTFKTAHIREFRDYVTKLHGKDFNDVIAEASNKSKVDSNCYCHYSMMCNYMWYLHRNEYAWHLQYVKPTRPSTASVPYEYFNSEVKPHEKIPHPRSSQHIRHFMLNGKYKDAVIPSERFVNGTLLEGLCYSFGIRFCCSLCSGYYLTNINVNLFNFENYDWLWDSRCMEKQIEHYQNVSSLFGEKFFNLDSREDVCSTIKQLGAR